MTSAKATLLLVVSNFLVTFGAFAVVAKLDPETARAMFVGIPGANRFLPYLLGGALAVGTLLVGLKTPRLIVLFSIGGGLACLAALGLWSQGIGGWPLLASFTVVYAALTLTWSLRSEVASRFGSEGGNGRLVIWVEASFAVAAMISFLIWPRDTSNVGNIWTALVTAAVMFFVGSVVDFVVYAKAPKPAAREAGLSTAAVAPSSTFIRWALAIALFTVGVQMTITKSSDNNVLLYLSFEVGTAIAGVLGSLLAFHLSRSPLAVDVYGSEPPSLRINPIMAMGMCLALMVTSFLLPSSPLLVKWSCLFAASLLYEICFVTVLSWLGAAASRMGVQGVVSGAKAVSVVLVVGSYWILNIINATDNVLMYVAIIALSAAIACILPEWIRGKAVIQAASETQI